MFTENSRFQPEPSRHRLCSGLVASEGAQEVPAQGTQKTGEKTPPFSSSCCRGFSPPSLLSLPQAVCFLPLPAKSNAASRSGHGPLTGCTKQQCVVSGPDAHTRAASPRAGDARCHPVHPPGKATWGTTGMSHIPAVGRT